MIRPFFLVFLFCQFLFAQHDRSYDFLIQDEKGDPISDVQIFDHLSGVGVVSNKNGMASVRSKSDSCEFCFYHLNFENKCMLFAKQDSTIRQVLKPKNYFLPEVKVYSNSALFYLKKAVDKLDENYSDKKATYAFNTMFTNIKNDLQWCESYFGKVRSSKFMPSFRYIIDSIKISDNSLDWDTEYLASLSKMYIDKISIYPEDVLRSKNNKNYSCKFIDYNINDTVVCIICNSPDNEAMSYELTINTMDFGVIKKSIWKNNSMTNSVSYRKYDGTYYLSEAYDYFIDNSGTITSRASKYYLLNPSLIQKRWITGGINTYTLSDLESIITIVDKNCK